MGLFCSLTSTQASPGGRMKVEGGDANSKTVTVEQSFNFGKYSAQISYRTRFSIAYASASQK
jgi:hypothetical protein